MFFIQLQANVLDLSFCKALFYLMIPQENHQQICPPKGIQTVGHRLFDEFGQGILDGDRSDTRKAGARSLPKQIGRNTKFSDKKDLVFRSNQ